MRLSASFRTYQRARLGEALEYTAGNTDARPRELLSQISAPRALVL